MKNKTAPLLCLILLLGLSGCRRQVEEKEYTVTSPLAAQTLFTGVLEDGTAKGSFTSAEGWSFQGTAAEGTLLHGTVTDFPYVLTLGENYSGLYSGGLENGMPSGEGVFSAGELHFVGNFSQGLAIEGEVTALPWSIPLRDILYTGLYSGKLGNGRPDGQGRLDAESAARQSLSYEGGWAEGAPGGKGTLDTQRISVLWDGEEYVGSYSGETLDGVPQGEGRFASVGSAGTPFTYEGSWAEGQMDGKGILRYEGEGYFVRQGSFTRGRFTPDFIQLLNTIGSYEPCFTLTEAQTEFIESFPELWAEDYDNSRNFMDSVLKEQWDKTLTIRKCVQTPEVLETPDWMCQYSLRVIASDAGPIWPDGRAMTRITAFDSSYNVLLRLIVPSPVEDLYRGQRLNVYAIPLAFSTYTTVLGEEKPCLVLLVGDMQVAF